ncbi:uncharacterized protein KIAA1522 homolog isoform X2 [Boleophthalmus pectinirostris]|uniref:uncharacterized protein KIAA1522 homolog isoform X2 n=1 Tax=Boleophthalmus pectinirostris TaxID=150288 RepID=UPI00242E8ABB|nr:uncharacterized protein KIAA1522 homolog isoform X2 [Boleophthalmus pectinirostris]
MVLLVASPQCDHSSNIYCFPPVFKKKAVPKRDDDDDKKTPAPHVLQENVFIEASRPKYLEDLHSEALEGLKLMQQEERILGPEYHDNESTISTTSARAEVDGGGFTTDSTLPDTSSMVSLQSSVSSRSSRSGLTRQGSTFRPLNSGKKPEKGRTRRRHRRNIGGIPQHLQREFGLDRAEWTISPQLEEEILNGESDVPQLAVHSPTETNTNTEVVPPLNSVQEEQLRGPAHVDDMALLQRVGPVVPGGDRAWPGSLAVPGMTTAGSGQPGPPSPVMSMSPQAAYLSKIIPNAVLPPSVEVVEISRGSSRNSVRTVTKSSLIVSSPSSSRPSSRASTARSTSSRGSTMTSASRQMHFHLSDSSCWSNSDSDTLVSDSSTISSSSTPRQREDKDASKKQNKVSDASKGPSNGRMIKGDELKKDGAFIRSLSVMKPKRAPPPPSRSYSLHNKMKRRSRDLAEVKITPNQTSEGSMKKIIDSPGYNADTSSLDEFTGSKTPSPLKSQQNVDSTNNNVVTDASNEKKEATLSNNHGTVISPSSGYSSQDAMSPSNSSPKHKKGLLSKLHKLFPASTHVEVSKSAVTQPDVSKTSNASVITVNENASVKALRELFSIPPHPKVHAPPPPPPEVWSHSPRSIELLLGPPAPENTYAIVKKNPKDKRPYRQPPSTCADGAVRSSIEEQRQSSNVESKKVHVSQERSVNVENSKRLMQNVDHGKVQVSAILNDILLRTVEKDGQRLPAIAEEHKSSTRNTTNPSISSAHISPQLPTKQTAGVTTVISVQRVTSPESCWPPPPPPVSQAGLGSPDETEFPLPPPPDNTEDEIVHPVQVPPDKAVTSASNMSTAPPLNIPPPPSYTAPPPPIKTFVFSEKVKMFSRDSSPPSPKTTSPPKDVKQYNISKPSPESPPPAPKLSVIPPPPEAPCPPPQELLAEGPPSIIIHAPSTVPTLVLSNSNVFPPPDLIPPSPPRETVMIPSIVAELPSQIITTNILPPEDIPPSPEVVSKPPLEDAAPPVLTQETSSPAEESPPAAEGPSPPVEVIITPPEVSVPPSEEVSTLIKIEVTQPLVEIHPIPELSIQPEDVSPQPSKEEPLSKDLPPQSSEVIADEPPEPKEEPTPAPKESPPSIEMLSPPQEVAPSPPEERPPSPKEAPPPEIVVIETSKLQVIENSSTSVVKVISTASVEERLENPQEPSDIPSPSSDSGPVSEEPAPQIETEKSEEDIVAKNESSLPPWKNILTPPQSIPPPPPIEQPTSDSLPLKEPNKPEEVTPNKPEDTEQVPSRPEVSTTDTTTSPQEADATVVPSPPIEEVPKQEPSSDTGEQNEEPASLSIKEELSENANHSNDQTVNGKLDSPKAEDELKSEVTATQEKETAPQIQSGTTDAPQKPIRKSLIISAPPSPPTTAATSPTLHRISPTTTITRSPTTLTPSMNLQEAIRLRTAARSQNGPSTRLSIHSPPGFDVRRSPTSTASFIFSKSNKKVVIETKSEVKAEKKTELTKAGVEQPAKKEFKVPPPVAKKPKTKTKEAESGDTTGQDAQSDAIRDHTKKPNGTAGTVGQ